MKVAIDIGSITPGASGGVAQAIAGLVFALGQLTDGDEEYILVVNSREQLDWLTRFTGANQRFVVKAEPATLNHRFSQRQISLPLLHKARRIWRHEESPKWFEVPLSDGFYEALGCEVIHFPHQEFILCALPSIYNPHDLLHLHYPQFFTAPTIARRETIYMHGTHFARTVAVASQRIKDDLVQHYRLAPEKIQVIPWGVPTRAFAEASPADLVTVKDKYRLEQPFAFFPARPWPHKNHLRLFEALASLRDSLGLTVQLVCTGSRYEPFWPQIESSLQRLKLEPQVRFLGFVPGLDLRAIYRLSHFLIMPTLFESDSFPVYEAWLDGVPVVCSNACSLPDQVLDAGILFDPHDTSSIAVAIAKLVRSVDLQDQLRKRGYRRVTDFDWERTAKAYRATYRQAAARELTLEERWLLQWDWMREPLKSREVQL